jgi:hypothetical protein
MAILAYFVVINLLISYLVIISGVYGGLMAISAFVVGAAIGIFLTNKGK